MATIGTFKKNGSNEFTGEIVTLSVQAKGVRIVPETNRANDNAPSHRVMVGRAEIGGAWTKKSNEGRDYLGLKLDDPSFNASMYANLFNDEDSDTCSLIWSRPTRRNDYPSPPITAPGVLVIDISPVNHGSGLALDRYYPIVLETEQESDEMEHFLTQPRPGPVAPNSFDLRPSQARSDHILIARYEPPVTGWPWLLICRWPIDSRTAGPFQTPSLARGCYTMEMFRFEAEWDASLTAIISSLSDRLGITFQLLAGEAMPPIGRT